MSKKVKAEQAEPSDKEREWEVEDGLNTLMRARDIEKNKDLMGKILELANKKKGQITSIAQMKARWNEDDDQEQEDTA